MTFIRASVILLYTHIFPASRFKMTCYGVLALNLSFAIGTVIAKCLICLPISSAWDFTGKSGACGSKTTLLVLSTAIINMVQDVIVVALPMPMLWRLQLARSKKLELSLIFGVGIGYGLPLLTTPINRVLVTVKASIAG